MELDDFPRSAVLSALDGVRLVYSDFRLHETALVIAKEVKEVICIFWLCSNLVMVSYNKKCMIISVQAVNKGIPILVDAERKREGLEELMSMATYVVCSANFPMVIFFYFL